MCKSRAEGGLRCSAHTKQAMVSASAALEAARTRAAGASTPGQRDKANAALAKAQQHFEEKQAEFFTSPAGIELIESKAQEARLAGDLDKAARFQEQAETNKAVRERQVSAAAVAQANYNWEHHKDAYARETNYNKHTGFEYFSGWNRKTDSHYDAAGYDIRGYNRYRRDRHNFDQDGYDENGYDADGYDRDGWDCYGRHNRLTGTRFAPDGYDHDGYNAEGYDHYGYDAEGYDPYGYDEEGLDRNGHDLDGWKPGTLLNSKTGTEFDERGLDIDHYDRDGYNADTADYSPLRDRNEYLAGKAVCLDAEDGEQLWAQRDHTGQVAFFKSDPSEVPQAQPWSREELPRWVKEPSESAAWELLTPYLRDADQ